MSKAIGMVEYKTVSAGMTAADTMIKTAEIEVIQAFYRMSRQVYRACDR